MSDCKCPETSVLRRLGKPIPSAHDCEWTRAQTFHVLSSAKKAELLLTGLTFRNRQHKLTIMTLVTSALVAGGPGPDREAKHPDLAAKGRLIWPG